MSKRVFLGGTCNGSKWRDIAKRLLDEIGYTYFDPVVPKWDESSYKNELKEREKCDILLYCITPKMTGVYSVAEVVDDSNKRPKKTVLVVLQKDDSFEFSETQKRSLSKIGELVKDNGGQYFPTLLGACRNL